PGVAEAAVVGEPDAERGEVIKALVVPRNGPLDVAALGQHCAAHLGKQKRPHKIEVVRELPKNFLGKVQRRKLREAAAVPPDGGPPPGWPRPVPPPPPFPPRVLPGSTSPSSGGCGPPSKNPLAPGPPPPPTSWAGWPRRPS